MSVPIVALYGAANALISIALAANVSRLRGKSNFYLGTGDSPELLLATRRHGNNAEYLPLALVLLLIVELSGGAALGLHLLGGALTLGRVLHAIGVGPTPTAPRALGAVLTWVSIAGAGLYGAVLSF